MVFLSVKLYTRHKYVTKDFSNLDLSKFDSIMIVAHPDDEVLWGGSHLMDGKYLVVCITAGNNPQRAKEFLNAMEATDDVGIMLGYPDKTFGKRNDWHNVKGDIKKDLEKLLKLKKWKNIVTHNENGEYKHIHHIMTNQIVTQIYNESLIDENNLYYFGKYYKKDDIGKVSDSLPTISDDNYKKKVHIIEDIYKSQGFLTEKFGQMIKYEDWTKYE